MSQSLARIFDLTEQDISVKAKTNEGLGFIGRGEGIAVMAVALLERR
jgi:2C-methyl-D-erythritol 2,4-cyclodiphosphate synthase